MYNMYSMYKVYNMYRSYSKVCTDRTVCTYVVTLPYMGTYVRVYVCTWNLVLDTKFTKYISTSYKYCPVFYKKHICLFKARLLAKTKKVSAAILKRRKWGLGIQIHVISSFILIDMLVMAMNFDWYTLLVLNRALYTNYIALAIVPSWADCRKYCFLQRLLDLSQHLVQPAGRLRFQEWLLRLLVQLLCARCCDLHP